MSNPQNKITDLKAHLLSRIKISETRFWEGTGCWEWQGAITKQGYGTATCRNKYVHRIAFEEWVHPIPAGLEVCHHCDNRRCINKKHLFCGTHKDNLSDAARKGRMGGKLLAPQVRTIRSSTKTNSDLARHFSVSTTTISDVKRGRRYQHVK